MTMLNQTPEPEAAGGLFRPAGEYLKDFFVLLDGATYHLFYNVGTAGPVQGWDTPGNEDSFGHATSRDLRTWERHERVMHTVPGTWEGMVVSAPSILRVDGTWRMIYTGFSDIEFGNQAIGLAESEDLYTWRRFPENPVYTGPAWTDWTPRGWADCRDAEVIRVEDYFLMYTTVRAKGNRGAVAIARSGDLMHWADLGPAFFVDVKNEQGRAKVPESPTAFERAGSYCLIGSQTDLYVSDEPEANGWERHRFGWPDDAFWAGPEVLRVGDRWIFAAFAWQMNGNVARFWDMRWRNGLPEVVW